MHLVGTWGDPPRRGESRDFRCGHLKGPGLAFALGAHEVRDTARAARDMQYREIPTPRSYGCGAGIHQRIERRQRVPEAATERLVGDPAQHSGRAGRTIRHVAAPRAIVVGEVGRLLDESALAVHGPASRSTR